MYLPKKAFKTQTVELRAHRYHVRTWGEHERGQIPLVLLHGWMDLGASFQFMVDELNYKGMVIAPDWRGFGDTQGPPCDHYVFADYLADLDFLLDHFEVQLGTPQFNILGHSMGGNVAMMYSGIQSERVNKLINLEGFGMPATRPSMAIGRYKRWLGELKALDQKTLALKPYAQREDVAQRLMKNNPRLREDFAHWLAGQWAHQDQGQDSNSIWHLKAQAAHKVVSAHLYQADEMLEIFKAISAPTLCVHSSDLQFDHWWKGQYTFDHYQERIKCITHLTQLQLENCGHMLHHDQPHALAAAIERFLSPP
jgi:pimeloyl-ACP methyl ester carboxylesterase